MTDSLPADATGGLSANAKRARLTWMAVAMLTTAVVVILLVRPRSSPHTNEPLAKAQNHVVPRVRAVDRAVIEIAADTPLHKELLTQTIKHQTITRPRFSVGGTVVARIRSGNEPIEDRWQFDKPELSNSYADWLRAKNEIDFAQSQLSKIKALSEAETSFLKTNLQRLESLTDGSIPEKDLRQAKTSLLKAQLQGDKDVFGAESALRVAINQKAAIERDLAQAGIEPIAFSRAAENMVLVAANVPESKAAQAYENQICEVHFYVYPDRVFPGHVESISSILTQERRTLRVLFDLNDDHHLLKPGMFAEVGIGTEPREAILIPAASLLHIGRFDYVLVSTGESHWKATAVSVGEVKQDQCEVLSGLESGEEIIVRGGILLKSVVAQALAMPDRIVGKP